MKDREGYNKGGDKREGRLIIDLDQTQTISRNLCLSVVHTFPPNVSCYHRVYCKSLPFFYFLTFEKGRLPYIHRVGWSVGWSVDVTINFFQYIQA